MGASHFFVGLGAGIAILTVPALTLGGLDLPHRFSTWIDGPPPQPAQSGGGVVAISRPAHGYQPGDPTPAADAPPTVEPALQPTPVAQVQPSFAQPPPSGSMRTGVIHAGGQPVFVRRAAGVESADDPQIADGAPVLVSGGGILQIGGQPWRAVRGLSGIVGWVPSVQVLVDGEAPPVSASASSLAGSSAAGSSAAGPSPAGPSPAGPSAAGPSAAGSSAAGSGAAVSSAAAGSVLALSATVAATPGSAGGTGERLRVANTDGVGVVLRNSPRDADKTTRGLMDGANVSVVERNGSDWVHVHADNGQDGWIPTRYVAPAL